MSRGQPLQTPTPSSRWVVPISLVAFTCRVFELMTTKVRHVSVECVCRGDRQTTRAHKGNTHPETLNGFKTGVSLLPSCRSEGFFCGDERAVSSEEVETQHMPGEAFPVVTAPRHVCGVRVRLSRTRHPHWKRRVRSEPPWCWCGSTLCTQMESFRQTDFEESETSSRVVAESFNITTAFPLLSKLFLQSDDQTTFGLRLA